MTNEELEARERILQATLKILEDANNPDEITIRQIALQANVGVGLINYHFQSKENLLQAAVTYAGGEIADQWEGTLDSSIVDPLERLKSMLKLNADIAVNNRKFSAITIRYELLKGEMLPCQILLPVLREIFGAEKNDQELRMISFSLVSTLQLLFIRDRDFRKFAGIDILNHSQRDRWIDFLVDNHIH